MRPSIGIAIGLVALALSGGGARTGTTVADLGLRAGPSSNTELLLTMPAGVKIYVGACSGPWCKVSWSGHSGYAVKSGLAISAAPAPRLATRAVYPPPGEIVPIYPPYPYRSGYYPKADWYFDIPPYTAIEPSFYRRHYFMMAQERDRYRFMPHIFRGGHYGDGGPITEVNMKGISASLKTDLTAPTPTTPELTTPGTTPPTTTTPPSGPPAPIP